jgi:hypothetical protein
MDGKSIHLHITNFVRPFTLGQARARIEEIGRVQFFWMNAIKSECFVTVAGLQEAERMKETLDGRVWPEGTGKELRVEFVPETKVPKREEESSGKNRLDGLFMRTKAQPQIYYMPNNCSRPVSRSRSKH